MLERFESQAQQLRFANLWALREEAVQPRQALFGETMPVFRGPFDGEQCTRI